MSGDNLSEQHLALFGAIMHWFARYECLIQTIMAKASGADCASVATMTRELGFSQKRTALLNLLRQRDTPLDQIDAIRDYLKLPMRLEPLRDDIAHSEWTSGNQEDSIQPGWILRPLATIRAVHDPETNQGGGVIANPDDFTEYTLAELAQIAERLSENYASFYSFLDQAGRI